ncbi:Protein JINGUBANG [Vitis vinifera]|uniref:Protein JINGUBANG n=1 Tax=Vitis vinifera TaxID=29760 RepID=A0A438GB68_VITVI|nr:Protein JINGUBANG [Vitis vinifera]
MSFLCNRDETHNRFLRSISTKEPSFSELPHTPSRLSSGSLSSPCHHTASLPSSPRHSFAPTKLKLDHDHLPTSHRCVSSVLKKDGQILSIAASNGLVYTGSETNLVRVWKLPEFTECGQLKTKACMVLHLRFPMTGFMQPMLTPRLGSGAGLGTELPSMSAWPLFPGPESMSGATSPAKTRWSIEQMKHMGAITSLAINISDDILYSASLDKTVKVWRISDHKCIETIQAHTEPVNAIVVADDGVLYTASDDATVRVWRRNFCSGDRPHSLTVTLPAKNSPVKTLSLTGDGAVLYGGCTDGYIHYWQKGWFSGQLQYGGALQGHTHAGWTREQDGQHKCLAVLQGHRGPVRCVSVLPARARDDGEDGCSICTGSLDGILRCGMLALRAMQGGVLHRMAEYFEV